MLVIFTSNVHSDIIMFGDVAKKMIYLMGHSGTIPGAIAAKDVQNALDKLKKSLEANSSEELQEADEEDDGEKEVSISGRAFPLIEMLEAASEQDEPIKWHQN